MMLTKMSVAAIAVTTLFSGSGCRRMRQVPSGSGVTDQGVTFVEQQNDLHTIWALNHEASAKLVAGNFADAADMFTRARNLAGDAVRASAALKNRQLGQSNGEEASTLLVANAWLAGYTWLAAGNRDNARVALLRGAEMVMAIPLRSDEHTATADLMGAMALWSKSSDSWAPHYWKAQHPRFDAEELLNAQLLPFLDDAEDRGLRGSAVIGGFVSNVVWDRTKP